MCCAASSYLCGLVRHLNVAMHSTLSAYLQIDAGYAEIEPEVYGE
jgi:hypothetical protein